jgi:hypothetical protein
MQDLLAGQVDLLIDQAANPLPQYCAGTIKVFAAAAKSRLAAAPEIRTVDEAGLPGFYASVWHCLWAPSGTPKEIVAKLNVSVVESLGDPKIKERFASLGQDIYPSEQQTPDARRTFQDGENCEMVADHQGDRRQGGIIEHLARRSGNAGILVMTGLMRRRRAVMQVGSVAMSYFGTSDRPSGARRARLPTTAGHARSRALLPSAPQPGAPAALAARQRKRKNPLSPARGRGF